MWSCASACSSEFHEVERWQRPAGELDELSADRDRAKIDAGEAELGDQGTYFGLRSCVVSRVEEDTAAALGARSPETRCGCRWLKAFTTRAPGTSLAKISVERRPFRSAGLKSGFSIGLLASITMRPPRSGSPTSASCSFDPWNCHQHKIGIRRLFEGACLDMGRQLSGKVLKRIRAATVGNRSSDAVAGKRAGEGGADLAGSNDADGHW